MIIRPYTAADAEPLADIWLCASLKAHSFIAADYWHISRARMVSEYLPNSNTLVLESEPGQPLAFISLLGRHIAALFVHPYFQGCGYGSALLRQAQQQYDTLTLNVYQDNIDAVHFYQYHGFRITASSTDSTTGAAEFHMLWQRLPLILDEK
ncbi:MAG: GNAT family N-acetyltransferase [Akkermansia sp.]|nr:GNAT family N-acetyltransferase [Akkermansia sp.]